MPFFFARRETGPIDFIAAFLGNPGKKYELTRHNAGFLTCDTLAVKLGARVTKLKFKALYGDASSEGKRLLLLKPQTWMNLSGGSVREAMAFYKLPPERLIVVYDDVALPPGKLRVRKKGSDGGHNGIKNIIEHLNTDEFARIKIGVGSPPHPGYDMKDWVTSALTPSEQKALVPAIDAAAQAVLDIMAHGVDWAMNKYNGGL